MPTICNCLTKWKSDSSDDQIKRLMEYLGAKNLTKKTLVVFTSDHGDSLVNYGIGHKGLGLYETLTHTPQIWCGYGVKHTAGVAQAFTSMADLMPALCEETSLLFT